MSEKWDKLANQLINLTRQGKLDWQETSDEDLFTVVVGQNAIEIEYLPYEPDFEVRVRDSSGKIIDKFTISHLMKAGTVNYYANFNDLFTTIRRQISGAEQVLDEILDELDKRDEIPF